MIWEVFRQEREGAPFQHGGSLEAPERAFAEAYAKEFYGRRAESFALWVVPRDAVLELREPYVAPVFDRDYRRVDGYSIKVKLREARAKAGVGADHDRPAGVAAGTGGASPAPTA